MKLTEISKKYKLDMMDRETTSYNIESFDGNENLVIRESDKLK